MIPGITAARRSATWTPVQLFGPADKGVLLDFSNVESLYQDSAGTVQVTATSDPIGRILDLSGSGNHLAQTVLSAQPLWDASGFGHFGTAVNQKLTSSVFGMAVNGSAATLIIASNQFDKHVTTGTLVSYSDDIAAGGGLQLTDTYGGRFNVNDGRFALIGNGGSALIDATGGVAAVGSPHIRTMTAIFSGPHQISARIDRSAWMATIGSGAEPAVMNEGVFTLGNTGLFAGSDDLMHVYGVLAISRILSDVDIAKVEDWLAAKAGITLT